MGRPKDSDDQAELASLRQFKAKAEERQAKQREAQKAHRHEKAARGLSRATVWIHRSYKSDLDEWAKERQAAKQGWKEARSPTRPTNAAEPAYEPGRIEGENAAATASLHDNPIAVVKPVPRPSDFERQPMVTPRPAWSAPRTPAATANALSEAGNIAEVDPPDDLNAGGDRPECGQPKKSWE